MTGGQKDRETVGQRDRETERDDCSCVGIFVALARWFLMLVVSSHSIFLPLRSTVGEGNVATSSKGFREVLLQILAKFLRPLNCHALFVLVKLERIALCHTEIYVSALKIKGGALKLEQNRRKLVT